MAIGTVKTKYGLVKGVEFTGEYEGNTLFKGIPYAAPPLGELRWRAPVDPAPWEGVRNCDTYGPAAMQIILNNNHAYEYYFSGIPEVSEDCLYLNVATGAQKAEEKRPVYIWFHGGGLTNCFSYEEQFNPQEMAKRGVVVVTVGHRLSLFGYLSLPQLTREQEGKSGNYGLMDQWKAVEWVVENIAAFGGDPKRITVGGQSGGSTKALAMVATPVNQGRIKGVISQSGLKMKYKANTLAFAEEQGRNYLRYIGLDPDISLEELRTLPTERLFSDAPRAVMPGDMVCDAELFPFLTLEEGLERYARDVDLLSGSNFGEADVYGESRAKLGIDSIHNYVKVMKTTADFRAHFRNLLGPLYEQYDGDHTLVVDSDASAYRTARYLASLGLAGWEGMNFSRNVMLNRMFGARRERLGHSGKTFTYLWTHIEPCQSQDYGTERDPEKLLAWHSSELWYVFNSLRPGIPPVRPWEPLDYEIADRMCTYWCNFIKNGDPNGEGVAPWPRSDKELGWMELGDEAVAHTWTDSSLERMIRAFVEKEYNYKV